MSNLNYSYEEFTELKESLELDLQEVCIYYFDRYKEYKKVYKEVLNNFRGIEKYHIENFDDEIHLYDVKIQDLEKLELDIKHFIDFVKGE